MRPHKYPIGGMLKSLREERGLSLRGLAADTGITKSCLWQLESGLANNPSFIIIKKLSDFYSVSLDYLALGLNMGYHNNEIEVKQLVKSGAKLCNDSARLEQALTLCLTALEIDDFLQAIIIGEVKNCARFEPLTRVLMSRTVLRSAPRMAIHHLDKQSVEYQFRCHPIPDDGPPRGLWLKCSKEEAQKYIATPVLHNWRYEVREITAHTIPGKEEDA